MRAAEVQRITKETKIKLALNLENSTLNKEDSIHTKVPFLDHMLTLMSKHGFMQLTVECDGDIEVDAHHTIEDVGICFGQALKQALGNKEGISRIGHCCFPMDETLALVAIDISGRPFLAYQCDIAPGVFVGNMDAQLIEEFFRAVAVAAGLTLHIHIIHGKNIHHILEAIFKAFGRALSEAARFDDRIVGVLSTKGMIE